MRNAAGREDDSLDDRALPVAQLRVGLAVSRADRGDGGMGVDGDPQFSQRLLDRGADAGLFAWK